MNAFRNALVSTHSLRHLRHVDTASMRRSFFVHWIRTRCNKRTIGLKPAIARFLATNRVKRSFVDGESLLSSNRERSSRLVLQFVGAQRFCARINPRQSDGGSRETVA